MCDFKPGDEVTMIRPIKWADAASNAQSNDGPVFGEAYTVTRVELVGADVFIDFTAFGNHGFLASCFRRVAPRRDRLTIEAFSVIKDGGFEEPKRAPTKKPEPVL